MEFTTPLSTAAWAALLAIPPALIALYFLKLRRRPVHVSSTMLWKRSMEDLHVNSLFQRLRRNLLLFLQLLAIGLVLFALLGPRWTRSATPGQRYILALDVSASMQANDTPPSRLEAARTQALEVIDRMESGALGMILAFDNRARVISTFTANKSVLRQRLRSIEPGEGTTSLREALEVAAGLANPASDVRARNLPQGTIATESMAPTKLYVFTDGGFPDLEGFSVGKLEPEIVVVGPPPPPYQPADAEREGPAPGRFSDNLGILALQTGSNPERPDQIELFGRLVNHRPEPQTFTAQLLKHNPDQPGANPVLIDAIELTLPPADEARLPVYPPRLRPRILRGRPRYRRQPSPRQQGVRRPGWLTHRPGLARHSRQPLSRRYADHPRHALPGRRHHDRARGPRLRRCRPRPPQRPVRPRHLRRRGSRDPPRGQHPLPGHLPPDPTLGSARTIERPVIADWNVSHPLMQYIRDLSLVRISKAQVLDQLPPGAVPLMETGSAALAFVKSRGGYQDIVVTFSLLDGNTFNTDWPIRSYSFPLFLYNVLRVAARVGEPSGGTLNHPGQPVVLRAEPATTTLTVTGPDGQTETLQRTPQGTFIANRTDTVGLYRVVPTPETGSPQAFAVNLLDARESDLATRGMVPEGTPPEVADRYRIKIGYTAVAGTRRTIPTIQEWWKPLALLALGVVLVEWYIYNRRIYV